MPTPTTRQLVKVKLADVPLELRKLHGQYLVADARKDGNLKLAIELTAAIYTPQGAYWLPKDALAAVHTTE